MLGWRPKAGRIAGPGWNRWRRGARGYGSGERERSGASGILSRGEVAEWLMAALLKSAESQDFVGSNPTLSASNARQRDVTPPGLCGTCRHSRIVESRRGSTFRLCERSATDPRFPRYPTLPVLECIGYEP